MCQGCTWVVTCQASFEMECDCTLALRSKFGSCLPSLHPPPTHPLFITPFSPTTTKLPSFTTCIIIIPYPPTPCAGIRSVPTFPLALIASSQVQASATLGCWQQRGSEQSHLRCRGQVLVAQYCSCYLLAVLPSPSPFHPPHSCLTMMLPVVTTPRHWDQYRQRWARLHHAPNTRLVGIDILKVVDDQLKVQQAAAAQLKAMAEEEHHQPAARALAARLPTAKPTSSYERKAAAHFFGSGVPTLVHCLADMRTIGPKGVIFNNCAHNSQDDEVDMDAFLAAFFYASCEPDTLIQPSPARTLSCECWPSASVPLLCRGVWVLIPWSCCCDDAWPGHFIVKQTTRTKGIWSCQPQAPRAAVFRYIQLDRQTMHLLDTLELWASCAGSVTYPHIDSTVLGSVVLQLVGTKIWLIWPPTRKNLEQVQGNTWLDNGDRPEVVVRRLEKVEVRVMEQGDVLYFPPGTIHCVLGVTGSMHAGWYVHNPGEDLAVVEHAAAWEIQHVATAVKAQSPSRVESAVHGLKLGLDYWSTHGSEGEGTEKIASRLGMSQRLTALLAQVQLQAVADAPGPKKRTRLV